MNHRLKQFTAALMVAAALVFCFHTTSAEAAPARLTNVHFYKWNNEKYTSFSILFASRQTVDGIQFQIKNRSGKVLHSKTTDLYMPKDSQWLYTVSGCPGNQVMVAYCRVFRYNDNGLKVYSAWSTGIFATPHPVKNNVKSSIPNKNVSNVKLKWSMIHGCNGYKVYVTTNPDGRWYLNKTTSSDRSTSVTLSSYRGSKLKAGTTYYVRVIARRVRSGLDYKPNLPFSDFYNGSFSLNKN